MSKLRSVAVAERMGSCTLGHGALLNSGSDNPMPAFRGDCGTNLSLLTYFARTRFVERWLVLH